MHSVFQPHLLLHEPGPVGHLLAEYLCPVVRHPYVGEPSAGEQPHEHFGVHLVGLNFRFGNRARTKRVGDRHAAGMLLEETHDGKRVAGGFQGHLVIRSKRFGEGAQGGRGG